MTIFDIKNEFYHFLTLRFSMETKKTALNRAASFINQPKNLILDLACINPKKGVQRTKTNKAR